MRALQGNRYGVVPHEWAARLFWGIVAFILFLVGPRLVVGADIASFWRTDFETALREAEQKKLPLMMHFYADWCGPCQKMEQTVFASSAVRQMLATRFVAVKLNSEKNQRLVHQYGFEILPTDMAVDPLTGKILALHEGYLDQAAYVKLATQVETAFQKAHPTPDPGSEGLELGDPEPVVGLDGYSPVAIMKSRKWVRGSASYPWDYKGIPYHMATREELLEFRKSPEKYAPKFLGCDPVLMVQRDRAIAGSPDFAAFYDDELYLFKSDQQRQLFKKSPQKYLKFQQAIKPEQIDRTELR